ncbi:MarR family winged helix-turn-helix transcriptional regulator [Roseivivax isoporae]|nr:MarR family winged helix-turn-helix transcriptional regulator [Roseivivax isoporae]
MGNHPRLQDRADSREGVPFLPDYVLFLLASTSAAASEEFHAEVRANGLRVPEWRVLACLSDADGQMVTRLAALSLMEQSRLTRIIDQMDARGLVERRSDAADRRRVRVFLTPAGADLARRMIDKARAHETALLDRLPGGSGRELKRLLRVVYRELCADD